MQDLEPRERDVHRVLVAVPPQAPPIGFRDAVMRRVKSRRALSELIAAAVMALPSAVYLAWELATNGAQLTDGIASAVAAAQGTQAELFVVVDGLIVLAVGLLGVAGLLAADALVRPEAERA